MPLFLNMQKVLVTGANGLVGQYLVPQLLNKNFLVIATSKNANRLSFEHQDLSYQALDYTNKNAVESVFETTKPAAVVHCGAISNVDECEKDKEAAFLNNVTGTIHLLSAAEKYKAHFIFLSTDFVFDGKKGYHNEEDVRHPVNYYGQTKLLAENEVMQYPFAWTIVRTVLVYGKSLPGRENFVTTTAKRLQAGQTVTPFSDQVRTPTYAGDLAKGIVQIIQKKAAGIYHLAGKDVLTIEQATRQIADYLNCSEQLIMPVKGEAVQLIAHRPQLGGLNIIKARKELGYEPLSFAEALAMIFS